MKKYFNVLIVGVASKNQKILVILVNFIVMGGVV